jgi:hypothetical protein
VPPGLSKQTQAWWRTLWASPMAGLYIDADVPGLTRLARLLDQIERGDMTAALWAEVRQLEDRFGLSPVARRRLQWEVSFGDELAAARSHPSDDKRYLRLVDD